MTGGEPGEPKASGLGGLLFARERTRLILSCQLATGFPLSFIRNSHFARHSLNALSTLPLILSKHGHGDPPCHGNYLPTLLRNTPTPRRGPERPKKGPRRGQGRDDLKSCRLASAT